MFLFGTERDYKYPVWKMIYRFILVLNQKFWLAQNSDHFRTPFQQKVRIRTKKENSDRCGSSGWLWQWTTLIPHWSNLWKFVFWPWWGYFFTVTFHFSGLFFIFKFNIFWLYWELKLFSSYKKWNSLDYDAFWDALYPQSAANRPTTASTDQSGTFVMWMINVFWWSWD